jgi:hypothetical protein
VQSSDIGSHVAADENRTSAGIQSLPQLALSVNLESTESECIRSNVKHMIAGEVPRRAGTQIEPRSPNWLVERKRLVSAVERPGQSGPSSRPDDGCDSPQGDDDRVASRGAKELKYREQ